MGQVPLEPWLAAGTRIWIEPRSEAASAAAAGAALLRLRAAALLVGSEAGQVRSSSPSRFRRAAFFGRCSKRSGP